MSGMTNYTAAATLNWVGGAVAYPSLPSVYLALFTGVGTGTGSGFTEVSGGSYARPQAAGNAATTASAASGATTISMATPSWVVSGMYVYNTTHSGSLSGLTTITATGATSITISPGATNAVSSGDTIVMTAFAPPSGTDPSLMANNATLTFATPTSGWGTIIGFGLYDAPSGGDLLFWDYLGNYPWLPCTVSNASPAVLTAHANGYGNGASVAFTNEYGGTVPTFSQGNFTGILTTFSSSTDTFSVSGSGGAAVNTSSTGNGMVRGVTQQSIPQSVMASFSVSALTLSLA